MKESLISKRGFDEYMLNAKAYCCSLCGGYDPEGPIPYPDFPLPVGALIGHNLDCPRCIESEGLHE